ADECYGRRVDAREDENVAGARVRDERMHHRVVARRAERRPCGPGDARPGGDPSERKVDDPVASPGLVKGCDAERGDRRVVPHSASTTTGSSRWKASAYRMPLRPEM